jgi:hypothetical protein
MLTKSAGQTGAAGAGCSQGAATEQAWRILLATEIVFLVAVPASTAVAATAENQENYQGCKCNKESNRDNPR